MSNYRHWWCFPKIKMFHNGNIVREKGRFFEKMWILWKISSFSKFDGFWDFEILYMTLLHLRFLILKAQIDIRSSLQRKWCQTTVIDSVSQRLKCFKTEILSARKGGFLKNVNSLKNLISSFTVNPGFWNFGFVYAFASSNIINLEGSDRLTTFTSRQLMEN